MEFSSEKLLKELDHPTIVDWALELKHRDKAYSFLTEALINDEMNRDQTLNALHAMFRIGIPDHIPDVLELFAHMAGHVDRKIRSEAVQLAIGMVRFCNRTSFRLVGIERPVGFTREQDLLIRNAVTRGLTPKVSKLARQFFP